MVQCWLVTTGKDYLAGTIILRREALPGERHTANRVTVLKTVRQTGRERETRIYQYYSPPQPGPK